MKNKVCYKSVFSVVTVLIMIFCISCKKLFKEEALTIPLQSYNGNELKVDGYYYRISSDNKGNPAYEIYFLYRNGVVLYGGFPLLSELPSREQSYMDGSYYSNMGSITNWGRFNVAGSDIKIEKWYPSSGGPYPVYLFGGAIENDTTYHLTYSKESHGEHKYEEENKLYHFKKLSPKPDSTNEFTN